MLHIMVMRVECLFGECACGMHNGIHSRAKCDKCGHAACWHRLDNSQFASPRPMVRRPIYEHAYEAHIQPLAPPLPLPSARCYVDSIKYIHYAYHN